MSGGERRAAVNERFIKAVQDQDFREAGRLLDEENADIDALNEKGQGAIHLAVFYGLTEAVKWLRARGADMDLMMDRRPEDGEPVRITAITGCLRLGIYAGEQNLRQRGYHTLVALLVSDADPSAHHPSENPPVFEALEREDALGLALLAAGGADMHAKNAEGHTLIMDMVDKWDEFKSEEARKAMLNLLAACGLTAREPYPDNQDGVLHRVGADSDLTEVLIDRFDADPEHKNKEQRNALFDAVANHASGVFSTFMFDGRCSVHDRDGFGRGPLHALSEKWEERKGKEPTLAEACAKYTVKAFVDAGGDLNAVDSVDETALHRSCAAGDATSAGALAAYGARRDIRSVDGFTPPQLARECGHEHVIEALNKYKQNRDALEDEPEEEIDSPHATLSM